MMTKEIITYIILAFVIAAGCGIISVLHERASAVPERDQRENYIVKPPTALKSVYMLLCFTGLFLFSFFLFLYLIGNKSATIGHLRLFLIVALIGLGVTSFASKSRLCVTGDMIELHRLFRRRRTITLAEIERIEIGKKEQICVYVRGQKFCTVDLLSENYTSFYDTLKQANLIKEG